MSLLKKNAECLATLVGVILYENLKGITETLGIGFAAVMFGVVLTVVGVAMTFMAKKGGTGNPCGSLVSEGSNWLACRCGHCLFHHLPPVWQAQNRGAAHRNEGWFSRGNDL